MATQSQAEPLRPRLRIHARQGLVLLRKADSHVRRFGERVLLTNADARSPVERQILPARLQLAVFPAFGAELVCILAVVVLAAVHRVYMVADQGALGNKHGREAIFAAAEGNGGVLHGFAFVLRHDGVQSQSY